MSVTKKELRGMIRECMEEALYASERGSRPFPRPQRMFEEKKWSEANKKGHGDDKVGKWVHGELYVHRSSIPNLSPRTREMVQRAAEELPEDAVWNCVKVSPDRGRVVFQYSGDFDTAHEPKLDHNYARTADSGRYSKNTLGDKTIWHHKWQWVDDGYDKFDYEAEKRRSDFWKRVFSEHEDEIRDAIEAYKGKRYPNLGSIIGQKDVWDNVVAPILDKYAENPVSEGVRGRRRAKKMREAQEYTSSGTSVNQKKVPLAHTALQKRLLIRPKTANFDLGAGKYDTAVELWASNGARNVVYDPYNRDAETNMRAFEEARTTGFDSVTCSSVLNVIKEKEIRLNTILQAAQVLKPSGVACFVIYEGNKSGVGSMSKKDCWQNNMKAEAYMDEISRYFGKVERRSNVIIASEPTDSAFEDESEWVMSPDNPSLTRKYRKNRP